MTARFALASNQAANAVPAMLAGNLLAKSGTAPHWHEAPGMNGTLLGTARDHEIYAEGDNADCFYKIVRGVVRTCKFLNDGRRQIDSFYTEGEIFGVEAAGTHRLSAEAVTDCTLIVYRRRNLDSLIASNETLARQLFLYALGGTARAQEHSLLLGRSSAMEKVTTFLLDWSGRGEGNAVALEMPRTDIADYLGLTVETISRTLSRLEKTGIIELATARNIRIRNRAALAACNE